MWKLRGWLAALAFVVASDSALSADISVGPLCLSGVKTVFDQNDVSISNTTRWVRATLSYEPASTRAPATLTVLQQPVVEADGLPPNCTRMREAARRQGIRVILQGELSKLLIVGRIGEGASNQFWIDPQGKLDATVGKVVSGLQPIGGGTIDLAGSRLWLRNIGEFRSTSGSLTGVFEVEAYKRTLLKAKIALPGGTSSISSFQQRDPENLNLVLRVNMTDGAAKLWSADFVSQGLIFSEKQIDLPLGALVTPRLVAGKVELTARRGVLALRLTDLNGSAAKFAADAGAKKLVASAVSVQIGSVKAALQQENRHLAADGLVLADLSAISNAGEVTFGEERILRGKVKAHFPRLGQSGVFGSLTWQAPNLVGLPLEVPPSELRSVVMTFSGTPARLNMGGSLDATAFGFAGLNFTQDLSLALQPAPVGASIDVPINIDLPQASGELTISDYDQKALVRATLNSFKLKATLHIDLGNPTGGSRINIGNRDLDIALSSAVSLKPWLAGTRPGFGNLAVDMVNEGPLVVRKDSPSGAVTLRPQLMVVAQPILRMGDDAAPRRASISLDIAAQAELSYPIDRRHLVLSKAKAAIRNTVFEFLDAGGSIDLGGVVVLNPKISLQEMTLDIDRSRGVQKLEAKSLTISGSRFERTRSDANDTAFAGSQGSPFLIERITGVPEFNETGITVRSIGAGNFSFGLADATLTLGRGLTLRNATVSVSAAAIESVSEIERNSDGSERRDETGNPVWKRTETFSNLLFRAGGKLTESEFPDGLHLDAPPHMNIRVTASGQSNKLSGSGQANISAFSGLYRDELEFKFDCSDGTRPRVPTESRFTTLGSVGDLAVRVRDGQFAVQGALGGFNAAFKSDTVRECDGPSQKHVISPEREIWTTGWCPTWDNPGRTCPWKTTIPEVSFGYHFRFGFYGLAGNLAVTTPVLLIVNGKTRVCFVPPVVIAPLAIALGISPQLEFNGARPGDVEKVLNGLIHAAHVGVESYAATVLANGAGIGLGSILSTPTGAVAACALQS